MLPTTFDDTPVVRTEYSDPSRWDELCHMITTPNEDDFAAYVEFVEDPTYQGLTLERVLALIPAGFQHRMVMVADAATLSSAEFPVLCVDLEPETYGRAVRVVAAELHSIENNISMVNMDFSEFVESVDTDGVFRGF